MDREELIRAESNSLYNNNQTAKNPKFKFSRKKSALAFIISIIFGGSFLFFGTSSLLGVHIINLFSQITDTQYPSNSLRAARIMSFALDGGNKIKYNWDGTSSYKNFNPYLKSRLKKNNIQVGHLDNNGKFVAGDTLAGKSRVLLYKDEIITADNFTKKFTHDLDFRNSYTRAKRGRAANYFDDAAHFVFKKLGLSRNDWRNFQKTGDHNTDSDNFNKKMIATFSENQDVSNNTFSRQTITDENGNKHTTNIANGEDLNSKSSTVSGEIKAKNHIELLSKRVGFAGDTVCTALKLGSMLSVSIAAAETYSAIKYASQFSENFNKSQTKSSNNSAINETLTFFNTSDKSVLLDPKTNKSIEVEGAPISSPLMQSILNNRTPSPSESRISSLDRFTRSLKNLLNIGISTAVACSASQGINSIIRFASNFLPGVNISKILVGMFTDIVVSSAVAVAVVGILSPLIPQLAQAIFSNAYQSYRGVAAGDLYAKGFSSSNERLARSASGHTPLSPSLAKKYQKIVYNFNLEENQIKNSNLHPLDPHSPNTFLGSLLLKLSSLNLKSPFSSFFKLTKNSLFSLSPVYATEPNNAFLNGPKDCEGLSEHNIQANAACGPVVGTDLSTLDIKPDDEKYLNILKNNLIVDENKQPKVKPGSDLAKYCLACSERESPFGILDVKILNALNIDLGVIGNNIPILESVIDLANIAIDSANYDWANGKNCVAGPENPKWDNNLKYLARYIEDMRILSQIKSTEHNPITAFKDEYYKNHPLDYSQNGIIARFSNLTTSDVALLNDFLEYNEIIANYHPNQFHQKIILIKPFKTKTTPIKHQDYQISYFNLRNRSFAI